MNFLAHLFLSCNDEALLVGNFMGDFVRRRQDEHFPLEIQRGLRLHRSIDQFTDQHPAVLEGVRLLRPRHRKYAPVILDVFYDYLLAKNWERYAELPLSDFTRQTYATLEQHLPIMPPVLRQRLPLMIADDWLTRYGEWEGLAFALSRIARRASQPQQFDGVIEVLQQTEAPLDEQFQRFFPDAIAFVQQYADLE